MQFQFLREHKTYIAFIAVVLGGTVLAVAVTQEQYPVLAVNGHLVSAQRFSKNYRAAVLYYDNVLNTYDSERVSRGEVSREDLELKVLNGLIESVLIDEAVSREVGRDMKELVAERVDQYALRDGLGRVTQTLYGLDLNEFRNEVLVPQAKKDILSARLFLKGQTFDDWMREAKRNARVIIFSQEFRWTEEGATKNP